MNFDYSLYSLANQVPEDHKKVTNDSLTSILDYFENKQYISAKVSNIASNANFSLLDTEFNKFLKWVLSISLPLVDTLNVDQLRSVQSLINELQSALALLRVCANETEKTIKQKESLPNSPVVCIACKRIVPKNATALEWEHHEHDSQITCRRIHNVVPSIINVNSNNLLDRIPSRYIQYIGDIIFRESMGNNFLFCIKCKWGIPCDINMLITHFESNQHISFYNGIAQEREYFCIYCNVLIKDYKKWQYHLHSFNYHLDKCYTVHPSRKKSMQEYDCMTCKKVLFGDAESIKHHINYQLNVGNNARSSLDKQKLITKDIPAILKHSFQTEDKLRCFIENLVSESNHFRDKDTGRCDQFLMDMYLALSEGYPQCKLHLFGSRKTALSVEDSDMDVFMDIDSTMYHGRKAQDAKSQQAIVDKCCALIKAYPKGIFEDVYGVPMARTPIVKVYHKPTGLSCDLSFRHGLSVDNTNFICLCIELQPKLRDVILFLKKWLSVFRLRTHLTSYALCILAIYYFQTKKYLPTTVEIRKYEAKPSQPIEGWPTLNYVELDRKALKDSLQQCPEKFSKLLAGFFMEMAMFKFAEHVVCPVTGRPVKKSSFRPNLDGLPEELAAYRKYVRESAEPEIFRFNSAMCVQDPFELQHNVTKAVPQNVLNRFKQFAEMCLVHLARTQSE